MKKTILLALIFCLWPRWLPALTVSEIKTKIRRNVTDNPSDTSFRRYGDDFLLSLINEAQREIVTVTWLADKTTEYVLIPGTSYYSLPTDLSVIHQAYFRNNSGQTIELQEVSQKVLYDQNPNWTANSGAPFEYWVSGATNPQNQQIAQKRISYIPVPTRTSTGTVTLYFYSQVADLSADSDIPFENRVHLTSYQDAIVYYVSARIKEIEGKNDQATIYQGRYQNTIGLMQLKLGTAPNYSPGANIRK